MQASSPPHTGMEVWGRTEVGAGNDANKHATPSLLRNHTLETGCQWVQGSSWHSNSWYAHISNRGAGKVRVLISADRPDLSPPHTSFLIAHAVPQCQPFPNALLPRMMALRSPQRALVFFLELVSCVSVYIRAHIPLSPSCVVSTRPYLPAMISTIIWSNHEKHHRSPR